MSAYTFHAQRDNAVGTLLYPFTPGDPRLRLNSGQGSPFGPVSSTTPIRVTVYHPASLVDGAVVDPTMTATFNVVSLSGDNLGGLTFQRGNVSLVFPAGSTVARVITQDDFAEIQGAVNDLAESGTAGVSISSPNGTLAVGGTAALPTLDVLAVPQSAVTGLTAALAGKLEATGNGSGLTGLTQSQIGGLHSDQSPTFAGATFQGASDQTDPLTVWKRGDTTLHNVGADGRTYWGNVDLGGTYNFFAGGARNLAQFQWQAASDGYSIVTAVAGNAVTGSLNGFLAAANASDRFCNRIQNAGTGDAVMEAVGVGGGSAYSSYNNNAGIAWVAGYHRVGGNSYKISAYVAPGVNDVLKITPLGATTLYSLAAGAVPLTAQCYTGATADTLRCEDSTGSAGFRINKNQCPINKVNSAPADADLANGDCAEWFDATSGRVCWKAKTAGGTVVTGYHQLT